MDEGSGRPREPDGELDLLARQVVDAAVEVHRVLGPGYLESIYEAALTVELRLRGIPFRLQHGFEIRYKGEVMGAGRVDFLVGDRLIVEAQVGRSPGTGAQGSSDLVPQGPGGAACAAGEFQRASS
jgi:PD-(D/E)XK nuclease superfamily